ncbi:CD8A protein, partial [Cettia cetti]|nr:CD8A protein [Cettia cetti]
MDTAPALLLLFTLGFCEYGHGAINARSPKDMTRLQVGQRLELECRITIHSGVFWIQQDKAGSLHFIVFISSTSQATFEGNHRASTRFEARREHPLYHLVVKSFTPRDEGKYFCVMNFNQRLYFSPALLAFLPATTTVAPTTRDPTSQSGTVEDLSLQTPHPERRMQEDLDFFCHLFIWVPLAGACLLLLIALLITIVLCQRKAHHNPSRCTF